MRQFGQSILIGLVASCGVADFVSANDLLVFHKVDDSVVAQQFETETLPQLRTLADSLKVDLKVIDPTEGAPEAVSIRPMIAFQSSNGRAIYQGRYTTVDRIRSFVQTSRFAAPKDEPLVRENTPIWKTGRATIAAPLKIAPLTGSEPLFFSAEKFQAQARAAVIKGLTDFKDSERVELGRGDRAFYMDFNPWRGKDGTLYLSYGLYSQFHCKKPVYVCSEEEKLVGSWRKRESLFAEAAKRLEAQVKKQLDRDLGDGFAVLPTNTPKTDWPPLPAASTEDARAAANIVLGQKWVVAEHGPADAPPILFRFPAPLDQYNGIVPGVKGTLTLGPDLALGGASGAIIADPKTITMGESDLDDALQGKSFLSTKAFPQASFLFKKTSSDYKLAFGSLASMTLEGQFTLRGKVIPLTVIAEVEPIVNAEREPRLLFRASWNLDFSGFDIEQADGPAPQRHMLEFVTNILFRPAE